MPWTPTSCSASFTSSSLNGFMIASIFFICVSSAAAAFNDLAGLVPVCAPDFAKEIQSLVHRSAFGFCRLCTTNERFDRLLCEDRSVAVSQHHSGARTCVLVVEHVD